MTLVEFLRARIAEDEAAARGAWSGNWPDPLTWFSEEELVGRRDEHLDIESFGSAGLKADARHIARHDPARVLAEVEAKRRIVDEHAADLHWCPMGDGIFRLLALPYADDPDVRMQHDHATVTGIRSRRRVPGYRHDPLQLPSQRLLTPAHTPSVRGELWPSMLISSAPRSVASATPTSGYVHGCYLTRGVSPAHCATSRCSKVRSSTWTTSCRG